MILIVTLALTFYVIGLIIAAGWGLITYYDSYALSERKKGARIFFRSPLWPLTVLGYAVELIGDMRRDLEK